MKLAFSEKGSGPALIILHGLYGQGDNWANLANVFAEKFKVILIDQRNHGRSPHNPQHSYEAMTSDLKEFLSELEIEHCYLLGHSMGGKTAMTFALQNAQCVEKLVVVDISPYSYLDQPEFNSQLNFHQNILERFANAPIAEATERSQIESFFAAKIQDPNIRRFLLKNLRRKAGGGFYWQLNVKAISENLRQIVDAVPPLKFGTASNVPALFIRGGRSPYISDHDREIIPDIFPNAVFETFDNAGHWVHSEEPERFSRLVLNWLSPC